MRTTLSRLAASGDESRADVDRATSMLAFVVLAAVAPAMLVWLLTAGATAAPVAASGWQLLLRVPAAVIRMLGLLGLAVLAVLCAVDAVAVVRARQAAGPRRGLGLATIYGAAAVAAVAGLWLLA